MHTVRYLEPQPYSSSVVVIDNGSVDQTSDLVARAWSDRVPVHLTGCAEPGKGAAVRRGILTSRARFVGYMDADLATPIETLDIVMPLLEEFQAVVGSRHIGGAALAKRQPPTVPSAARCSGRWRIECIPGIADTQCGFKFFAGDVARAAARDLRMTGSRSTSNCSERSSRWACRSGRSRSSGRTRKARLCARSVTAPGPPRTCSA